MRQCLLRSVLFLLLTATCFFYSSLITVKAQGGTATLSGTVTDENGALVSGVTITIMSIGQGFQRTTSTNDEGVFAVSSLPPSTYTVKAEREGFSTAEVRDVVLNVSDQRTIRIDLKIGSISQTVEIVDGGLVNESPAVATVVDRQFISNLPLNGRSLQPLLALTPGLVQTFTSSTEPGQFSVNGQRANSNYFTVDGVSANVGISSSLVAGQAAGGSLPALTASGGTNNLVSIDALQEFKVQTSTYAAEFGRTPGGQISIATRSGTNQFHGTMFEYFRNDVLDATDWFVNANRLPKPALRQNDFGGVLGGPLYLPRFGEGGSAWHGGENRTFFFFSYEGLRLRQPKFLLSDVPSLAARQTADESLKPFLNAFPLPNGPENVTTKLAPFSASFSNPSTLDATSLRIDHTIGKRLLLFGRYNYAPSESVQRSLGTFSANTLSFNKSTTKTLTVGGTSVGANVTNEFRANYSRVSGNGELTLDTLGGAVVPPDSLVFPSFTSRREAGFFLIIFGGRFMGINIGALTHNVQRQLNLVDNLSITHGSHALKFGVDYRRLTPIIGPRAYTQLNIFLNINQYLARAVTSAQINAESGSRVPQYINLSLYGQDTWKINRRLTLTYGMRWELNPPPTEKHGHDARTVVGFDDPATTALAPAGTKLYPTTYDNFAPRVGLSYMLAEHAGRETLLRGGFGVFYDLNNGQVSNAYGQGVFPYASSKLLVLAPFPLRLADATPSSAPTTTTIYAFDPDLELPYTLQYNLGVEQSLGANQTFSASYVGARGRRLLRQETLARAPIFASVRVIRNSATSDYDSLQVQYQRRLSRGLQALASYTFSKSLDNASNESSPLPSITLVDPRQDRGPSDFDIRHSFSAAITYNIRTPNAGEVGNAIFRGWSVESIFRGSSAPPANVITGATFFGAGSNARPDLVQGVPVYLDDPSAPGGRRINRAAFIAPPVLPNGAPTRQGTLGRNALRGFPLFQTDLTARRQFNLSERVYLQFRADFFNIFNHPNFGPPCINISTCGSQFGSPRFLLNSSVDAGGTTGAFNPLYQVGGPRSIQFSLKLQF